MFSFPDLDDGGSAASPHHTLMVDLDNNNESVEGEEASEDTSDLVSVSVKILARNEKRSGHKTFMLRSIDMKKIETPSILKREIYAQFGNKFVDEEFKLLPRDKMHLDSNGQ